MYVSNLQVLPNSVRFLRCEDRQIVKAHAGQVNDVHESTNLILFVLQKRFISDSMNLHHVSIVMLRGVESAESIENYSSPHRVTFRQRENVAEATDKVRLCDDQTIILPQVKKLLHHGQTNIQITKHFDSLLNMPAQHQISFDIFSRHRQGELPCSEKSQ